MRPYTPISSLDTKGHLDLAIKVYPIGNMSQHVDKLNINQTIKMKGTAGKWTYKYEPNSM